MERLLGALYLLALAVLLGAYVLRDGDDAQVIAHIEREAHERKAVRPEEICISQYGPGERWSQRAPFLACSTPARAVPDHVLNIPVEPK